MNGECEVTGKEGASMRCWGGLGACASGRKKKKERKGMKEKACNNEVRGKSIKLGQFQSRGKLCKWRF